MEVTITFHISKTTYQ